MLGRSIYEDTKRDIQDHANNFTLQLEEQLASETKIYTALQKAGQIANLYHGALTVTMFSRLREIGFNAIDYYAPELDPLEREQILSSSIDVLAHQKYHGLTLPQRLKQSHLQLRHNIRRSGTVGAKLETRLLNITRVFNDVYPFGAQKNWDTRLFLAEAVRLEHVIAKSVAKGKNQRLVKWTLSHAHKQLDVCDILANAVDPNVENYIAEQKYKVSAGGVYFIENVPKIPHPNCQCVIKYLYKKKSTPKKKLNLIRRIIKAIFSR